MNTVSARDIEPWYRQPLVWMIIAIPASSVLVGIFMLVVSIRTYDGLVVDDYYKRGVQINRRLARDERARSLGLRALLEMDGGGIRVQLDSATGGFVPPPQLTLLLSHSTRSGLDRLITLDARRPGRYEAQAVKLEPGRWYLALGNEQWRLTDAVSGVPATLRMGVAP